MSELEKALERLAEAATTTVTARFTEDREIPALIAAISDAKDVIKKDGIVSEFTDEQIELETEKMIEGRIAEHLLECDSPRWTPDELDQWWDNRSRTEQEEFIVSRWVGLTEIQFCTRHGAEKYPESHHRCRLAEKAESPSGECKFAKAFVDERTE